jgi:sugar lactone lactonase YvrE
MKKIYFSLVMIFCIITMKAQISSYTFAQAAGTYTALPFTTGLVAKASALSGANSLDDVNYAATIPFTFVYDGNNYTSLTINTNGFVMFGTAPSLAGIYNPISGTDAYSGAVAAFGNDLNACYFLGDTGRINTGVVGTSPNREFVIQYSNFKPYSTSVPAAKYFRLNFQIRLSETSNKIKIVYNSSTIAGAGANPTDSLLSEVGLRGSDNTFLTNVKNRKVTGTVTWASSIAGTDEFSTATYKVGKVPAAGQTYTFTPPVITPCSGTPAVAAITSNGTIVCPGSPVNLSLSGNPYVLLSGITKSWEKSLTLAGTYTAIPSATGNSYSATTPGFYRLKVSCGASNSVSNVINLTGITIPYATLPYTQSFETAWLTSCVVAPLGQDRPTTNWVGAPASSDSSWRRDNTTIALSGWAGTTGGAYTPVSSAGARSARFHSYDVSSGNSGSLDLYVNLSPVGNKNLSFDYINPSGSDSITVLLSTNGGTSFTKINSAGVSATWASVSTIISSTSATCVIRFKGTGDFGADDIGLDNVNVQVISACVTPPVGGTISVSPTTVAAGTLATISGIGQSGTTYTWKKRKSLTAPFLAFGALSASSITYTDTAGTYYFKLFMSKIGCPTDSSNSTTLTITKQAGDDVCTALPLTIGINGPYINTYASVQVGEPNASGTNSDSAWLNAPSNSLWFTLVAPASGRISVQAPSFDAQLALWAASSCANLLVPANRTLVAANDDDTAYLAHSGVEFSSYLEANCLTPGATYYVQLDGYSTTTDTTTIVVTNLGTINTSFTGVNSSYCLPAPASITLTPAAAGGVWSGPNVSSTGVYTPPLTAGLDSVTYTINGCSKTKQIITLKATPVVTASASSASVCTGGTVTLTGGGAASYTWDNGVTNGVAFSPSGTTTYTVTGTAANTCTNTATVTVTVNTAPTVTANTSAASICAGGTVTLTGGGAASYSWNNGVTNGVAFSPSGTTTYTVTGTAANTCTNIATVTVTVNTAPTVTANASSTSICAGGTVTLTGGGAATYTWDNGVTNGVAFSPSGTTTYTVTGTAANTCTNTATVTVTVNAQPVVNLPATISTCNASTLLDAGNAGLPGIGYLWSNGATTQTITVTINGTYSVTATGTGGCNANGSTIVTLNSGVATANLSPATAAVCVGKNTTLVGTPSGGTYSSNAPGGVFTGATTGAFKVFYTVTTSCGTAVDSTVITVNANPITSITPSSPTICAGGATAVTLTGTPAGGTFTVQSGTASALTGNSFNPAATGTWTIVYTFTNASGCSDTSNINFNVNCTVGLNDLYKGIATISAAPNPTNGYFDLNISNAADKASIRLLSFDGRLLSTEKIDLNQSNTVKMNMTNFANGIYFINVVSGNVNKTIKITKQD